MNAALAAAPLRPPDSDRIAPGLVLALLVHVALVALLVLNVDFHTNVTATSAEAELWSAVPQAAAPRAVEPTPLPEPPRVQPAPEPAPQPDPAVLRRDAEIALAQQKAERERELQQQRAAEQQRLQEAQRRADEAAQRKRLEAAAKPKPAPKPPPQDTPRPARAQPPQDDKARAEALKRILGQAGATGDAAATGTAQRSAGFSASYAGRIAGRIKPNVVFPDALPGNPAVEVELRMSADGHIVSRRVTKASGAPDWDQAVLRAIDKTDMLPPDTDGRVPPVITRIAPPQDLGG